MVRPVEYSTRTLTGHREDDSGRKGDVWGRGGSSNKRCLDEMLLLAPCPAQRLPRTPLIRADAPRALRGDGQSLGTGRQGAAVWLGTSLTAPWIGGVFGGGQVVKTESPREGGVRCVCVCVGECAVRRECSVMPGTFRLLQRGAGGVCVCVCVGG